MDFENRRFELWEKIFAYSSEIQCSLCAVSTDLMGLVSYHVHTHCCRYMCMCMYMYMYMYIIFGTLSRKTLVALSDYVND